MENELGFMIRGDHFKYTLYDNGDEMLIDLKQDPGEMVNLSQNTAYRERKAELKALLQVHIEQANR